MGSLDLNLLLALHTLLQERSVTRAARRLGLTQPTLSGSLARLRRHFNDELIYRSGNNYDLTPLAVDLSARTGVVLDAVERLFAAQPGVDPATSEREFVILASDYGATVAAPALSASLRVTAPGVRLHLRQSDPRRFTHDEHGLRAVDGLLMPHGYVHGLPHLDLFEDRWVCLIADDHPTVGTELTMADLSRLPWAAAYRQAATSSSGMRVLAQAGLEVRVEVVVDHFLALPWFVAGTDRVALVQERLARLVQPFAGVRVVECPFDPGPVVMALWWHPDFERDAEHAWMRDHLAAISTTWTAG